jgi:hypothetical protein
VRYCCFGRRNNAEIASKNKLEESCEHVFLELDRLPAVQIENLTAESRLARKVAH